MTGQPPKWVSGLGVPSSPIRRALAVPWLCLISMAEKQHLPWEKGHADTKKTCHRTSRGSASCGPHSLARREKLRGRSVASTGSGAAKPQLPRRGGSCGKELLTPEPTQTAEGGLRSCLGLDHSGLSGVLPHPGLFLESGCESSEHRWQSAESTKDGPP